MDKKIKDNNSKDNNIEDIDSKDKDSKDKDSKDKNSKDKILKDKVHKKISRKILCNLLAVIIIAASAAVVILGLRLGTGKTSDGSENGNTAGGIGTDDAGMADSALAGNSEGISEADSESEILSADAVNTESSIELVSAEDSYNGYIDVKAENSVSETNSTSAENSISETYGTNAENAISETNSTITDNTSDYNLNINLYLKDGYCYVMLPSYYSSDRIRLDFDEESFALELDGKELSSGDDIPVEGKAEADRVIGIYSESTGIDGNYIFSIMRSENIPSLYISTRNGTMDYINEDKSHQEPGEYLVVGSDGKALAEGTIKSIHARGTSSFTSTSKKSYKVNLDSTADLIGSGKSDEYILLANSFDSTKMRNILAYQLANKLSPGSASKTESVDVYFNGNYSGNYLICEPVQSTFERLQESSDGSYLIAEDWVTDGKRAFEDKYGDQYIVNAPEDVTIEESKELHKKLINIENLIENCDTESEYEKLKSKVDIESFVMAYIMDVIVDDADGNRGSTYYYFSSSDGKLYAGPEWDYDRAWGNNDEGREQHVEFNVYDDGLPVNGNY